MLVRSSAAVFALFLFALQTFALPPHGFFSGDQGAKYLQARALADHPLDAGIDVRSADIDPRFEFQEPILRTRRGRLLAEFSWPLPVLTAPFLALVGFRGLYVVPALSAVAIFLCCAALAAPLGRGKAILAAWIAVAIAPVMFYGLELWEHAPAAACVALAAALMTARADRSCRPSSARQAPSG
jgi:hypothetical protein